jgi:hypothetical protein
LVTTTVVLQGVPGGRRKLIDVAVVENTVAAKPPAATVAPAWIPDPLIVTMALAAAESGAT